MLKRLVRAAVVVACAFGAVASASADELERDFMFNTRNNGPYQMFGRTMIAVTEPETAPWSVQLWPDFTAHFTYSSGKGAEARYTFEEGGLCFYFGEPGAENRICKILRPIGRGYDWITLGQEEPTSKIIFSQEGERIARQEPVSTDVEQYRGAVLVGRTIRDREIWIARLDRNGRVDFAYPSGARDQGRYVIEGGAVCMTFGQTETCKVPVERDGGVLWLTKGAQGAVSELIYVIN